MALVWCGIAAGALQALGYVLYVRSTLRRETDPNAATWFMFAYGTFLLGVLEHSRGAEVELLLLPTVCAVLSIGVAFTCWKRGTLQWPEEWQDRLAFFVDILLTVCYAGAWGLAEYGILDERERGCANLVFLACSNLTTVSSFVPLIRGTKSDPSRERALPWVVWACAYALLGAVTFFKEGLWTEFMLYPVLNAFLHGYVARLAHRKSK